VGDEPADRDASKVVQQRQHGLEHGAANVLEVDVDAFRAGRLQPLSQIGLPVVETSIEAEFLPDVAALPFAPGNADGCANSFW
jgi:hypothetical protein